MKRGRYQPVPGIDQLRQELKRIQYREQYGKLLKSTLEILLVVAAVCILAATLWLPVLKITGDSMSPALQEGDIVICVRDPRPEPGELVSFYLGNKLLVKRCIAGGGQRVTITEAGDVYINDMLLEEPYASGKGAGLYPGEFTCRIPQERFFCLGDRRDVSVDSRSELVGPVPLEQAAGRPVLRVWPLSRFGLLK